ncbi:MAG TPA: hypothetical protein ENN13_01025 [Candidatus Altiarchaeales archaeon]|nr:hypothetical protein [Candidatus Altiarchaeales archaeon]
MIAYLDTNFLLAPHKDKIQVFEELEELLMLKPVLKTTMPVVRELELISQSKGQAGSAAKVAIRLLEKHGVEVVESEETADDSILTNALKDNAIVCTNDRLLMKKAGARKLGIVMVSGKSKLILL